MKRHATQAGQTKYNTNEETMTTQKRADTWR